MNNKNVSTSFSVSTKNKKIQFKENERETKYYDSDEEILTNQISYINKKNNNKENYSEFILVKKNSYYILQKDLQTPKSNSFSKKEQRMFFYKLFNIESSLACICGTKKTIYYYQDLNSKIPPKTIFNLKSEEPEILNVYFPKPQINNNSIYIYLSNFSLIEIDFNQEQNKDNNFSNYFDKQKKEQNMRNKTTEYVDKANNNLMYSQKVSWPTSNNNTNIIAKYEFYDEINHHMEKLIHVEIYKDSYIAYSTRKGSVYLLNKHLLKIELSFIPKFGQCPGLIFSDDGNLLSISAQDNNCYIVHISSKIIVGCLVGHKNYISNVIFEKQDVDEQNIHIPQKIKPGFSKKPFEELIGNWEKQDNIRKTLNSKGHFTDESNNTKNKNVIQDNKESFEIYDIFSSGLDGYIGSYKIEICKKENESEFNDEESKRYENCSTSRNEEENTIQLNAFKTLSLYEEKNERIHPIFLTKILNEPIIQFKKDKNYFLLITKRDVSGKSIKFLLFDNENKKIEKKELNKIDKKIHSSKIKPEVPNVPEQRLDCSLLIKCKINLEEQRLKNEHKKIQIF